MIDLSVSQLCLDKEVLLNPLEFLHEMSKKYIIPPGPLTFEHIKQLPACLYDQEIVFGAKENFTICPKPGYGGAGTIVSQVQPPSPRQVTHFQGTVESVISDPHGMGQSRGREVKIIRRAKNTLCK